MAYVKYKELTKYFNFSKEIDKTSLPKYVTDYVDEGEIIYKAYKTLSDRGVFTNDRMVLFDCNPISKSKKIHIIPYDSISTGAVLFKATSGAMLLSFDSGYQIRLNFIKMDAQAKTELRKLFSYIMNKKGKKD